MDFSLSEEQVAIREAVERMCASFDDDYWLECDRTGTFPEAFRAALIEGGWLGIAMPEEFGGSGLGITEAAILMHAIAGSAGAMSAASTVHINIFGPHPIVVFGNDEQKQRWLPDVITGRTTVCFGVTEPDAGLDTGSIRTMAEKSGNGYVVNGKKIWTSTAGRADKILLLARTSPYDKAAGHTRGLSLFYTDLDRDYVEVREIEKMGRAAVDSNEVFIDGLPVSVEDRIGEEGDGLPVPSSRTQSGACPGGRRSRRHRAKGHRPCQPLCPGSRGFRQAHRPEPGDSAPTGRQLDGAGSCMARVYARCLGL